MQRSDSIGATVAAPPSANDEQLADKVQAALHADPYFYDEHVTVSIEHGNVVLRGFVASGWDLIRAKKIAAKVADGRRVVDYLSINPTEVPTTGVRR
ncbi:MAG: BON domain-containing protein [Steroidobacteraceae bacterium]